MVDGRGLFCCWWGSVDPKTTNGEFWSLFRVNEIMGERWARSPWLVVAGFHLCMHAGRCLGATVVRDVAPVSCVKKGAGEGGYGAHRNLVRWS